MPEGIDSCACCSARQVASSRAIELASRAAFGPLGPEVWEVTEVWGALGGEPGAGAGSAGGVAGVELLPGAAVVDVPAVIVSTLTAGIRCAAAGICT